MKNIFSSIPYPKLHANVLAIVNTHGIINVGLTHVKSYEHMCEIWICKVNLHHNNPTADKTKGKLYLSISDGEQKAITKQVIPNTAQAPKFLDAFFNFSES